jgi:regulatory protein
MQRTLSLKGRALRLLGQREHSRAELERKLARHAESREQLARVLDELQARGFIDHARVADSIVHRRSAKLGALRIRQELQSKGVEPQLVAAAVASLRDSELQRAHEVWCRKFGAAPADAAARARQARFLASRGFSGEVIRKVLGGAEELG